MRVEHILLSHGWCMKPDILFFVVEIDLVLFWRKIETSSLHENVSSTCEWGPFDTISILGVKVWSFGGLKLLFSVSDTNKVFAWYLHSFYLLGIGHLNAKNSDQSHDHKRWSSGKWHESRGSFRPWTMHISVLGFPCDPTWVVYISIRVALTYVFNIHKVKY